MKQELSPKTIAIIIVAVVIVIAIAGYFYTSGGGNSYKPLPKFANRIDLIRHLHGGTSGGGH